MTVSAALTCGSIRPNDCSQPSAHAPAMPVETLPVAPSWEHCISPLLSS